MSESDNINIYDLANLSEAELNTLLENLTDEQAYALLNSWDFVARPEQIIPEGDWRYYVILAGRGWGKGSTLNTSIPTPTGWTTMGEIKVGDQVFDEQGNVCNVTFVTETYNPEITYEVTFSDGAKLTVCSEHQWVTMTHANRKAYLRSKHEDKTKPPRDWVNWKPIRTENSLYVSKERIDYAMELYASGKTIHAVAKELGVSYNVIKRAVNNGGYVPPKPKPNLDDGAVTIKTTQDIVETLTYSKRGDLNHCIPQTLPLNLPDADLPIHPYVLGVWLGDGCSYNAVITQHQDDMPFLRAELESLGYITSKHKDPQTFGVLNLSSKLKKLGVHKNKHIPISYLRGSYEQRLALLQGLMDTDGTIYKDGFCEFNSSSERIARGVYELIVSLGMRATFASRIPKFNGDEYQRSYRIKFAPTEIIFRLPRKLERLVFDNNQSFRRYHRMITSVERVPSVPMRCITVDSPNSMYLAGEGMIPTHNTRTIIEWAHKQAMLYPNSTGAIVGATSSDITKTLILGESGFHKSIRPEEMPRHNKNENTLTWRNGSRAFLYSADEPERLRGFSGAWAILDEFCAWRRPMAFTMLDFGLREGSNPQCLIATTPKPVRHLLDLLNDPKARVIRGSTYDNAANLADSFLEQITKTYLGTRLGAQEIFGEVLDDQQGAIWSTGLIQANYVPFHPELERVVIGVDPAVSSNEGSNLTGIVVCGIDANGIAYVLADLTIKGTPKEWAEAVRDAYYLWQADTVVAEINQGGDLIEYTIHAVDPNINVSTVRAIKSKSSRAQTVHLYYQQGRVRHLADRNENQKANEPLYYSRVQTLETQMTTWVEGDPSPDAMDAMVHALRALLIDETKTDAIAYRTGSATFNHSKW